MQHLKTFLSTTGPKLRATSKRAIPLVVGVLVTLAIAPLPSLAQSATTVRPISDFTSTQGTFCPANPSVCIAVSPAYLNFTDPIGRIAVVDFAGVEPVAGILGTTTSGMVTERSLENGTAEVHVVLQTHNALVYVRQFDAATSFSGAFLFGRSPAEVQAGGAPGVGDSSLAVTFINSAPGAQLPDLILFIFPDFLPKGVALERIQDEASATGPLRAAFGVPEGTPGQAKVGQTGLFTPKAPARSDGHSHLSSDGFSVENIVLHVIGR